MFRGCSLVAGWGRGGEGKRDRTLRRGTLGFGIRSTVFFAGGRRVVRGISLRGYVMKML